jgi:predicted HTH transcriptional regulator
LLTRLTQYAHQLGVGIPQSPNDVRALEQARERHLVSDHNGKACATCAGWLLFATLPQTVIQNARIEFSTNGPENWVESTFGDEFRPRPSDRDENVVTTRSLDGHLWSQLTTALDLLALVNRAFRLKEARSRTADPYDPQALKEIIVNALVHRDYAQDEPVRVEVMPDRIRIVNPGGIVEAVQYQTGDVSLEQAIRSGRRGIKGYRNPVISDLFYGGQEMDPRSRGDDITDCGRASRRSCPADGRGD